MHSLSELSPKIIQQIKSAHYTQEDYRKAMGDILALGMGLPNHTQVEHVAKMFAAYRDDETVRMAIGDNINYFAGWVMPEMYLQLES